MRQLAGMCKTASATADGQPKESKKRKSSTMGAKGKGSLVDKSKDGRQVVPTTSAATTSRLVSNKKDSADGGGAGGVGKRGRGGRSKADAAGGVGGGRHAADPGVSGTRGGGGKMAERSGKAKGEGRGRKGGGEDSSGGGGSATTVSTPTSSKDASEHPSLPVQYDPKRSRRAISLECMPPAKRNRARRERNRRDRVNDLFEDLIEALGVPPKENKSRVLTVTMNEVQNLRSEIARLQTEQQVLLAEAQELKQEKTELSQEKISLKEDTEILQQRLQAIGGFATPSAAGQGEAEGSRAAPSAGSLAPALRVSDGQGSKEIKNRPVAAVPSPALTKEIVDVNEQPAGRASTPVGLLCTIFRQQMDSKDATPSLHPKTSISEVTATEAAVADPVRSSSPSRSDGGLQASVAAAGPPVVAPTPEAGRTPSVSMAAGGGTGTIAIPASRSSSKESRKSVHSEQKSKSRPGSAAAVASNSVAGSGSGLTDLSNAAVEMDLAAASVEAPGGLEVGGGADVAAVCASVPADACHLPFRLTPQSASPAAEPAAAHRLVGASGGGGVTRPAALARGHGIAYGLSLSQSQPLSSRLRESQSDASGMFQDPQRLSTAQSSLFGRQFQQMSHSFTPLATSQDSQPPLPQSQAPAASPLQRQHHVQPQAHGSSPLLQQHHALQPQAQVALPFQRHHDVLQPQASLAVDPFRDWNVHGQHALWQNAEARKVVHPGMEPTMSLPPWHPLAAHSNGSSQAPAYPLAIPRLPSYPPIDRRWSPLVGDQRAPVGVDRAVVGAGTARGGMSSQLLPLEDDAEAKLLKLFPISRQFGSTNLRLQRAPDEAEAMHADVARFLSGSASPLPKAALLDANVGGIGMAGGMAVAAGTASSLSSLSSGVGGGCGSGFNGGSSSGYQGSSGLSFSLLDGPQRNGSLSSVFGEDTVLVLGGGRGRGQ